MENKEANKEKERDNGNIFEEAGNFLINGPEEILDRRYLLIVKKLAALHIS